MQLNFWEMQDCDCTVETKSVVSEPIALFVDGASRGNPGHAGAGVVIMKGSETLYADGFYLGRCTNNEAEYWALLLGLQKIFDLQLQEHAIVVFSDSQLLVRQITGEYRVKSSGLKKFFERSQQMLSQLSYSLKHVMRECNIQADAMANQGIDRLNPIPHATLEQLRIAS